MSFTVQISGFTLGASILNVDLYGCTGSLAQCTGGTASDLSNYFILPGYTGITRLDLLSNNTYVVVPNGIKSLKVRASNINDGGCVECSGTTIGDFCNLTIPISPTPTPTPVPTNTPTPVPTNTPTPVPTDTPTPLPTDTPTPVPTDTPTPTPTLTPTPVPTDTLTPTPTPTLVIPIISLSSTATCSSDPCFTAGTTSYPCSGRVPIDLTNAPSPYTIEITYTSVGGGTSIASLVYDSGLPYVELSFGSGGNSLNVSAVLKNGSGVEVASSTIVTYAPNSTFNSGLPTCPGGGGQQYYYYALGDCTQIQYSYTAVTSVGYGVGYVKVEGCNIFGTPAFDPLTSYYYDFDDPCGFTTGYTVGYIRSTSQLTEGDVYNYSGGCYSIVQIPVGFTPTSFIESSELGSKVTGSNPCQNCQPPYTGFSTFYAFDGYVCGTNPLQQTVVMSIAPYVENSIYSLQLNTTYAVIEYDNLGNLTSDGYCVTVTGYSGTFSGQTVSVPMPGTVPLIYENRPVGPNVVGGGDITGCNDCQLYYNHTTVRCDGDLTDLVGYPIWSQQKLNIGDVVTTTLNDNVCRKVTEVWYHKFKPYKGNYQTAPVYVSGVFSGGTATENCQSCTTAGGSGGNVGDTGNVVSLNMTSVQNQSTYSECGYPNNGTYYNEYSENVTVTFLDSSGTSVTPNGTVQYSMDDGVNYTTVTVTSSTYTFPYPFTWREVSVCSTADRIVGKIRINNVTKPSWTWTAGSGQSS